MEKDKNLENGRKAMKSALDGLSDRLNNRFDMMDVRKKGALLLILAAGAFILGMVYLYSFLSKLL